MCSIGEVVTKQRNIHKALTLYYTLYSYLFSTTYTIINYDLELLCDKNLQKCSSSAISAMNQGPIFVVSERGRILLKETL